MSSSVPSTSPPRTNYHRDDVTLSCFLDEVKVKLEQEIILSDIQARIPIYNGWKTKRKLGPFMIGKC